jgi:hypothetical protein
MMKRITFVAGVAAGYVLGTRAGQKRYEQIKAKAEQLWSSDQVQQKVEVAKQTLADKAPVVAEKVGAATRSAGSGIKDKVQGSSGTDQDTVDLTSTEMGAGTLGSPTLGTGVTGDDRAPGMGPGGDRLP